MIPVHQTSFELGKGDCFRACLASVLELGIENFPNFRLLGAETVSIADEWLSRSDLAFRLLPLRFTKSFMGERPDGIPPFSECILVVPSQAYPGNFHAVVGRVGGGNYEIVHDPNPHNAPYSSGVEALGAIFLVTPEMRDEYFQPI